MWNFSSSCVCWQFVQHDLDVYQAIAATIHQENGRLDIPGWKFSYFVKPVSGAQSKRRLCIIIEHLEASVPDDLKPVHHGSNTSIGV